MTRSKQAPISTIALRRIDLLTGRVFTLGALLTGGETVVHAYNQSKYLDPLWLWPAIAFLVGALVYNFVNFWFLKANRVGYLIHGVAYAFAYLTWWQQAAAEFPRARHRLLLECSYRKSGQLVSWLRCRSAGVSCTRQPTAGKRIFRH